jgi:RND superfamily putative drug exporter
MQPRNLAGRAGRWSVEHWKTAFFGWLVFAVAAFAIGTAAGHRQIPDSETASGEAARAQRILEQAGFKEPAIENVLVQSRTATVDSPAFRSAVVDVVRTLSREHDVIGVRNPLGPTGRGQISRDRRSALVQFAIVGDADKAKDKVAPILAAIARVDARHPRFTIEEFGPASATKVLTDTLGKDFKKAEALTLPMTLVILLFAFGALVAAALPVLLAFSAVLASIGIYSLITHVLPGDFTTTQSVILLIGMAVGVDYSLFYLRREREERHVGRPPREALLRAAATSGQAVLISGATVLVAMAGMFIAGNKIFTSIAIGTMLVVLCAVIGSVTVLAALLARLGDRVDKGRIPFVGRRKHEATESRVWRAVLDRVLRRPVVAVVLSAGLLVALTVPVRGMHTKLPSFTDLPHSLPIVATYERITQAFPGAATPAVVVVRAPDVTAPLQNAIAALKREALATRQMKKPIHVAVSPDRTVARVDVPLVGSGDDEASVRALETLRKRVLPATLGRLTGVEYAVTGLTAGTKDFNDQMKSRMPYVFLFVLGLAFVLLLMTFRSLVIPLKAIVLNLLSVGAAFGVLVLVFQHRWAEGILGFRSNGAITSWLPLFLFVVLFGLSMDYHVFILSRIKELADRGMKTEHAVSYGIRRTAGTVTSAALVMIAVFAIFATLRTIDMKQMGVGLAVAVLIDATLVRAVLLPASMKLLGEWNWYLPRWLDRLPVLSAEVEPGPPEPPATAEPRAAGRHERVGTRR